MASHGAPRLSKQQKSQEAYEKEQQKIKEYRALDAQVKSLVDEKTYTQAALDLTSKLLTENPEYQTRWNDRRRILQHLFAALDPAALHDRVRGELDFLLPLLMKFPKTYAIWNHRIWLLQQPTRRLAKDDAVRVWQDELKLDNKMLSRDARNFHGWNYRRMVVGELERLTGDASGESGTSDESEPLCEQEFAFTTTMIRKNLSNFSAWHNRSNLIPQILRHRRADEAARKALHQSELAFVKEGLFMDPYDQSLWYYHNYLMSVLLASSSSNDTHADETAWVPFTTQDRGSIIENEIKEIRELLDDDTCTDCKWIYQYLLLYTAEYLQIDAGNKVVTTQEMRAWLAALRKLDPSRSGRWKDWEQKLDLQ